MPIQSIELEEILPLTVSDEQLESYTPQNGIMTQWTCASMTICGCY